MVFVLAMCFWPSLGCGWHTLLVSPFGDLWGKSSVSFPGAFMSAICRLNVCSGGTLMSSCSGEKLQGEVYQKVNQLIPHCQFYLGLLWGIRRLKSKGVPGLFIHQSVSLFLPYERGSHLLFFCLCFGLGPPVFLPQWWLTTKKVVCFVSSFFCCCSYWTL